MALNPTVVLRHIERKLGASHHQLELSQEDIIQTVIDESLLTFSNYFPHFVKIEVNPEEDLVEGHNNGVYHLKTEHQVLGISKIFHNNTESGLPNISSYYGNPFDRQIQADMMSLVENPILFEYHAPNIFEVYPKSMYWRQFLVQCRVVHPAHMATIPLSMRDEFLKLALYDVQESLLKIRHHFSNINTTFGNIELFMQDLEEASQKRQELLELWRGNFAKSSKRKKIWVY